MPLRTRDRGATWSRATCLAAAIACGCAAPLFAQDVSPPDPATRPRLNVSFADALDAQKNGPKKAVYFRWQDHPTIHIGKLQIGLRARVQMDTRASDAPFGDDEEVAFDVARRRIGIEGQYGKYVDYQVEREIADDVDPWRDVYVNYKQFDQGQFQYGKFKIPFSLDENTSPTNLDFVYRSLAASTLAPGRDRGWMAHGRLLDRIVRYEFGIFDHDGSNGRPKNHPERVYGGQTEALRVSAQPFRRLKGPAEDFHVGVAWTWSDVPEGFSGLRGQTVFSQGFFSSKYYVLGERKRSGVEVRWRPGPFSVKYEYIKATEERLGESVEDTDLSPLRSIGWYLSGTWAITGEKKADGLDAPRRPLFQGGYGAIEVAARVERLTFDSLSKLTDLPSESPRADQIVGNSDRVITLGANWYVNRWVKVQFNLIQETLTDPSLGPLPTQPTIWSRILRFQFQL
jgi:phosphate-selective porin OprO/OprP